MLELKATSPWYEMQGVPRFRFTARYPNDSDVVSYYSDFEQHRSQYPEPKPSEKNGTAWDRVAASWSIQVKHILPLIESAEMDGEPWVSWREDIENKEAPHFLKRSLMKFADYLFRDPAESSSNGSQPKD